jgi:hypothetical protein
MWYGIIFSYFNNVGETMLKSIFKFIEKFLGTDREYYSDHYNYDYGSTKKSEVNDEKQRD